MTANHRGARCRFTGLLLAGFLPACSVAAVAWGAGSEGTFVYRCEQRGEFTVRIVHHQAWVFTPGNTLRSPCVESGSGAKYRLCGTVFWHRGESALLQTDERSYRDCRSDRARAVWQGAKLRGVDFRPVGNEPGWHLEISQSNRVLFVTDYGNSRFSLVVRSQTSEAHTHRYEPTADNDHRRLILTIEGRHAATA